MLLDTHGINVHFRARAASYAPEFLYSGSKCYFDHEYKKIKKKARCVKTLRNVHAINARFHASAASYAPDFLYSGSKCHSDHEYKKIKRVRVRGCYPNPNPNMNFSFFEEKQKYCI
jgi:hypothetical protein